MKKLLMTAVTALTLASIPALAAPQVYAIDAGGMEYNALYTESSWMAIEVPLAALGETVPSDLSLAVSGLPAGTTIALDSVSTRGDTALLHVTISRTDESTTVNALADISVISGGEVLTTVSIPVLGAAYGN